MSTSQTVPQVKDTAIAGELYMSFELGGKSWKLTASDGHRGPSRYNVDAGETAAVTHCIGLALERCKLEPQVKVHSCYEAGRDGWWLHRWLIEQGIDNIVVDSSSIEVNRHARRAKTDRIRPGTGSNSRHTPTSDQDAPTQNAPLLIHSATRRCRHEMPLIDTSIKKA